MHFNEDTIENLNKFAKSYKFKITYFYGYIVKFDVVNIHAISPHNILFSKNDNNLLVLHYDDYMENENLYFADGERKSFTTTTIKRYIRD